VKRNNHISTCDVLTQYFPNCRRILGDITWDGILAALGESSPESFIQFLHPSGPEQKEQLKNIVPHIYDLACIELGIFKLSNKEASDLSPRESVFVNPDLMLVPVSWKHLPDSMTGYGNKPPQKPESGEGHVLIWRDPGTCHLKCRDATDDDLLALKLVVEEIDFKIAARRGKTSRAKILAVFYHAVNEGILINPKSRIRRNPELLTDNPGFESYMVSDSFTLQWHITQACDLHCRHCYDRSSRHSIPFSKALEILDDFFAFTLAAHVRGHISFTGGNPLLYPDFENLYYEASQRGFSLAILGNPAQKESIARLQEIQPLTHYQISLEGLEEYNDYIRGMGHFKKSLDFLDILREQGVYSMVMLTLNRDNMNQVLPLAEILREKTDSFTFNRLAMVGEGAALTLPDPEDYRRFLQKFVRAAESNPVLRMKDNLINIVKQDTGRDLFGGCTGFGCGAAFNFVALLPDGEVHACRKFPSYIGSINENSLDEIYTSARAKQYRDGSTACKGCRLSPVCRGCQAVAYGMGLNVFTDRDPFCFYDNRPSGASSRPESNEVKSRHS